MSLFDKIFSFQKKNNEEEKKPEVDLPLDDKFVHNFTKKEGKFLYSTQQEEVNQNIKHILEENGWGDVLCFDDDLDKMLFNIAVTSTKNQTSLTPFFTTCEHLIAKEGSILFSSNQLKGFSISDLPKNFIVFAKTSQIVTSKNDALMSINKLYKKNIPSNIGAINSYNLEHKKSNDFMNYGSINSKNLYLLLLEDL